MTALSWALIAVGALLGAGTIGMGDFVGGAIGVALLAAGIGLRRLRRRATYPGAPSARSRR